MQQKMPAAFITDFGPMPAVEDDDYTAALGRLGRALPRPRAILVMSGHWEVDGTLGLTASPKPETIHDYSGFPKEYYQVSYPAPGDPALAEKAASFLNEAGFPARTDPARGLDHGAWAPLSRVFPDADVPTVQIGNPARAEPEKILAIGRALAPLRDEGVLLAGAGTLSHNLRLVHFGGKEDAPDPWAREFDSWVTEKLDRGDLEALRQARTRAPNARLAIPTPEHFSPFVFILGAAGGEKRTDFYHGIKYGNGLLRAFTLGQEEPWRKD